MKQIVLSIALFITLLFGQNRGFPMHASYQNCIKPNHISQTEMDSVISDFYFYIRNTYITAASSTPGGYYVLSGAGTGGADELVTHSEAHGYGMLTTVLMAGDGPLADPDAKSYFDGLFQVFDDHRSTQGNNLMSWQILDNGSGGEDLATADYSATDGDMDIAYALLLAHYQWGSTGTINYLQEALDIIESIKEFDTNPDNMRLMLGDWVYYWNEGTYDWYQDWDNGGEWVQDTSGWILMDDYYWATRSSDWMSGHLHAFADATNDSYWTEMADTIYALAQNFTQNYSNTGLISDFVDGQYGGPADEYFIGEFQETNQYYENACRVPLRLSVDYAHNGSTIAKSTVNGMVDFIRTKTSETPSDITFGYNISTGDELYPSKKSSQFTSPVVAGAIVASDHQQFLNDGWDYIATRRETYFPDYLTLLSMLLISGNWWPPTDSIVTAQETPALQDKAVALSLKHQLQGGTLNVEFSLPENDATVSLFSLNGRRVSSVSATKGNRGSFTAQLSTAGLSNAIFLMRITTKERSVTERLMVR